MVMIIQRDGGRHPNQGIITPAARDFLEGVPAPGRHVGQSDLDQQFLRLHGGGKEIDKKFVGRYPALAVLAANVQLGLKRNGQSRQLGGRIGMSNAAAKRTPVADLGVGNVGHCFVNQRRVFGHQWAMFNLALPGHSPNTEAALTGG